MQTTNNQIIDFVSTKLEALNFNYEYSELNRVNSCDIYKHKNSRYLIHRIKNADEEGINFFITDAKRGTLSYNSLKPDCSNVVFQGKVTTSVQVDIALKLINFKGY